jgi:hypothetical protein
MVSKVAFTFYLRCYIEGVQVMARGGEGGGGGVGRQGVARAARGGRRPAAVVGLYKLNSVDPELESAWFQPLNLKCDILLSIFAFRFQLAPLRRGPPRRRARRLFAARSGCTRGG